jgi:hypothetical protein
MPHRGKCDDSSSRVSADPDQAAIMLATLVKASCSANVLSKLSYHKPHYTIRVPQLHGAANEMIQDGPSMLFDLIAMVSVETKSTVGQLTNQLSNLQPIMEQEKSNVQAFNKRVQDIKAALSSSRYLQCLSCSADFQTYVVPRTLSCSLFAFFRIRNTPVSHNKLFYYRSYHFDNSSQKYSNRLFAAKST